MSDVDGVGPRPGAIATGYDREYVRAMRKWLGLMGRMALAGVVNPLNWLEAAFWFLTPN